MNNRLLSLQLAGYKSIASQHIDFSDTNILIGANGAGKSNLIGFFRLLTALRNLRLQVFVGQDEGGANDVLHFGARRTPQMEATLTFAGQSGQNRYHFRLGYGAGNRLLFLDETIQYCQDGRPWETARSYSLGGGHFESLLPTAKVDMTGRKLPEKTPGVVLHLMRGWQAFQFHDTSRTAPIKQPVYKDNGQYLKADGGNLSAFLLLIRETSPTSYETIVQTVRRVLPSFDDFVLVAHPSTGEVALNWKHQGSDDVFGPHQLSDGSLRFMALAALLLQPELPPLILIDEPELGLHPFAIELLAGMLRSASSSSQLIVSTQSVTLANQFGPQDVLVVENHRTGSSFIRHESEPLAHWLAEFGLGDLWAKNLIGGTPE